MKVSFLVTALATVFLSGCTDWFFSRSYSSTDTGELKGKIIVEWIDQDKFIFIPDPKNPLRFTRQNKEVIQPGRMYTDGGSVPAALRAVKSYSPWGYAPAFIIHDWLFVMKQCGLPGNDKYNLKKAATIMGEVLKTIMESPKYGGPNKLVHYSMIEAVKSSTAQDYWDNGKCSTPTGPKFQPDEPSPTTTRSMRPVAKPAMVPSTRPRFTIEF